ncbi:hypothetical protein CMO96_00950 [Candidatus Woesebacteria bacterium]|nr:hypothetical protein [Candidatus Woesebacteria bacterium]|tara:strand:- start:4 stop:609 length:606 start_codon:yes stop_codon:yes gene_type:complete
MKTAGLLLIEARKRRKKSLAQISGQTKIKEKFLKALESSDWESLPNFSVACGFAKSYAQIVSVDPELVAALLRRDFPQIQTISQNVNAPLGSVPLWTPKTTILAVSAVTILVLAFYLVRQYMVFVAPPPLEVIDTANAERIVISGKTSPNATVEVVGQAVLVEENGSFSVQLGKQDIVDGIVEIEATSRAGKTTTLRHSID